MEFKKEILNKFYNKQLDKFLKANIVNYNQKIKDELSSLGSSEKAIAKVLNTYISSLDSTSEDLKKIESNIFSYLFYQDQETYYYKDVVTNDISITSAMENLQSNQNYSSLINKKLYNYTSVNNNKIVSIRQEHNDLLILFDYGKYITKQNRLEKSFLVSIRINFELKVASFGFKKNLISKIRDEDKEIFGNNISSLIKNIIRKINNMSLGIEFLDFSEDDSETALYKLFIEESKNAINLIKRKIGETDPENGTIEDFKIKAKEFLKEVLLLEKPENFVAKALDLKYQDKAIMMSTEDFVLNGGYIFGFGFVEKQVTRSENRSDMMNPIFKYKLFWSLRDIIDDRTRLAGLSMYWKFNKYIFDKSIQDSNPEELTFVELEYRSINKNFSTHYFVKIENLEINLDKALEKKRREDYALYRIVKYIREEQISDR